MSQHTTSVLKREVVKVNLPKNDPKKTYVSIHFGTDVIWISREQARQLRDALTAVLEGEP